MPSVTTYTPTCMYNMHVWMHPCIYGPHNHMHTGIRLFLCFDERNSIQRSDHEWVPGWCHTGETHACCGETFSLSKDLAISVPADPSPPHRRLLISCSGPSWEPRETSQQMGFHLVTLPTARLDYMANSSGAVRPKLPGVFWVGSLPSRTWTHPKIANCTRIVCSFYLKKGGWDIHKAKYMPMSFVESRAWICCSGFSVLITRCNKYSAMFRKKYINDRNLYWDVWHVCLSKCCLLQEDSRDWVAFGEEKFSSFTFGGERVQDQHTGRCCVWWGSTSWRIHNHLLTCLHSGWRSQHTLWGFK